VDAGIMIAGAAAVTGFALMGRARQLWADERADEARRWRLAAVCCEAFALACLATTLLLGLTGVVR
jgi:hypothetical protein